MASDLKFLSWVKLRFRQLNLQLCQSKPAGTMISRVGEFSRPYAPRTMRMLRYPANDTPADSRNVGISAHTDFESFTILCQTARGLELTDATGHIWQIESTHQANRAT
jgi:hypothetical protein